MALAALPLLAAGAAAHAQISLYTATDLALRNSPEVRIGVADVQRAAASVSDPVRRMASKISMWRRRMAQTRDGKCDSMPRRVRRCRTACLSCAVGPA